MTDDELMAEALQLDPTRSNIVMINGTKGSGKSELARAWFDGWPGDRVVLDPTGNARPDDPHTIPMIAPFPSQIPEPDEERDPNRSTIWARLDPRSATLEFDDAQATEMALAPRHRTKLIWKDEFGVTSSQHKMSGPDKTLIMSSRHYNASALMVCPRPRLIATLLPMQADKIATFALPNVDDREYLAKNAGIPVPVFERAYQRSRAKGKHAFLLFDRQLDALLIFPPLPGITGHGPKA